MFTAWAALQPVYLGGGGGVRPLGNASRRFPGDRGRGEMVGWEKGRPDLNP